MRSLIAVLLVVLFLLLPGNIILLIGHFMKDPLRRDRMYLHAVQGLFVVVLWFCGTKVTVLGRENVPTDRPVLYVSNHRSYFDIVIAYMQVVDVTGFVAKDSFQRIPLFATWMRRLRCFFLNRENLRQGMEVIRAASEEVKAGISVWICPEGTRNHNPEMLPFREGSFKIAERSGCPIVPVAFTHTDDLYENHTPWVRPGSVTVEFGAPIETADLSRPEKKALPTQTRTAIEELYRKNF